MSRFSLRMSSAAPTSLNQPRQDADQALGLAGLIHQRDSLADVGGGGLNRPRHLDARGISLGFCHARRLLQTAVALGDLPDGLATGSVPDEQAQLPDASQVIGDGHTQIADRGGITFPALGSVRHLDRRGYVTPQTYHATSGDTHCSRGSGGRADVDGRDQ